MPLLDDVARSTDSQSTDQASKRLYEDTEGLTHTIHSIDAICQRIYSANNLALSAKTIEDSIPYFQESIRRADSLPKESIKSAYNALRDDDPAAAQQILETLLLPLQTRVVASATLVKNNKFLEAKAFLDEAKQLEPLIEESTEIRMLQEQIYAGLKSQGIKVPGKTAVSRLLPAFEKNLNILDNDKNGFVSQDEISSAVINETIKGEDAHLVAVLKRLTSELMNLSNDEFGLEDDGITVKDMQELDSLNNRYFHDQAQYSDLLIAQEVVARNTNSRSGLTRAEVQTLVDSGKLTPREKHAVNQVLNNFDNISFLKKISPGNIGCAAGDIGTELNLVDSVNIVMEQSAQRLSFARDVYSTKNHLESIKPEAVRQGHVGDCYFLAGLASMAAVDPKAIDTMIKTNADGTYTVTFPASPKEPITVKAPTDSELSIYAAPSEFGTWVPIVEKAYGEYCNKHFYRRRLGNLMGTVSPTDSTHGGTLRSGVDIFSKHGTDSDVYCVDYTSMKDEINTARKKLTDALNNGRPVTARSLPARGLMNFAEDPPAMSDHALSVTAFDPVTDTVTVRDPAGDSPIGSASTKIPLNNFVICFNHVTYGK